MAGAGVRESLPGRPQQTSAAGRSPAPRRLCPWPLSEGAPARAPDGAWRAITGGRPGTKARALAADHRARRPPGRPGSRLLPGTRSQPGPGRGEGRGAARAAGGERPPARSHAELRGRAGASPSARGVPSAGGTVARGREEAEGLRGPLGCSGARTPGQGRSETALF